MACDPDPLPLLELPDPCLLAVLRCCAADSPRSLFSAARAHSRLHQAAVLVLSSVAVHTSEQHNMDSMLLYLNKHGKHVCSIALQGRRGYIMPTLSHGHLPLNSLQQLTSLTFSGIRIWVHFRVAFAGMRRAGASLKRLQIFSCQVVEDEKALAAALSHLPALEHLTFDDVVGMNHEISYDPPDHLCFPGPALPALAQLTHLELLDCDLPDTPELQHLQRLTRLQHLRLCPRVWLETDVAITASAVSALRQLTRLDLQVESVGDPSEALLEVEPAALAGHTQLQLLALIGCSIAGGPAGIGQLLSHLQPLQQLTYLDVSCSLREAVPAVAAYSALTVSSKLQHLSIRHNILPAGVWRHLFPAGRRLPQLQELHVNGIKDPADHPIVVPHGSRLVSFFPSLRRLAVSYLWCSAELLSGLSCLQELNVSGVNGSVSAQELQAVCQLSALQRLALPGVREAELVVQLSQLQHLTRLDYPKQLQGPWRTFKHEAPDDEPVWRQAVQFHAKPSAPAVAQ